jgi:hypothetical protein
MHFGTKSYLKSNHNHTVKQAISTLLQFLLNSNKVSSVYLPPHVILMMKNISIELFSYNRTLSHQNQ